MNKFEEYLQEIVTLVSLDERHKKDLIEDVELIREYVLDILKKQNPTLGSIYVNSSTAGINISKRNYFDVYIVFDNPKVKTRTSFDRLRPGCLSISKNTGQSIFHGARPLFIDVYGYVNRLLIGELLRETIEKGLLEFGCYIRGHKGEIYELEINISTEEGQVLLVAHSENEKLEVDFKILVSCKNVRSGVQPHPLFKTKSQWFAALVYISEEPMNRYKNEAFAICTPNMELEVAQRSFLTMAYRFLKQLLPDMKEVLLKSVVFEEFCIYRSNRNQTKLLLGDALMLILRRMEHDFNRRVFPFYWNTHINLLKNLDVGMKEKYLARVRNLLKDLVVMKNDNDLSYETVERFFGVHVDASTIKIDCFGAFKSFEGRF